MNCGGGVGGYIASRDEERYVREYPTFLVSITGTVEPGEFGFGLVLFAPDLLRHARARARTGPATRSTSGRSPTRSIWRCSGPQGSREVGEAILQREPLCRARGSTTIAGREHPLRSGFFKEFVVDFGEHRPHGGGDQRGPAPRGIFGGKDLSAELPELGQSALYCVTEIHTQADIDRLGPALAGGASQ